MNYLFRTGIGVTASTLCFVSFVSFASPQTPSSITTPPQKEKIVAHHANGTFEVTMTPQPPDEGNDNPAAGRMTLAKHFHGDLEADSKGQMLAVMTDVEGSAGYVAMERVTGTLNGRSGSFALQHSGTMARGAPQLSVTVVPDSGTGELIGIKGKMTIDIVDGKHFYEFEYTLPENP